MSEHGVVSGQSGSLPGARQHPVAFTYERPHNAPPAALFFSITSDDWKRALARDIQRTNSVAEQIRAAEIDILR